MIHQLIKHHPKIHNKITENVVNLQNRGQLLQMEGGEDLDANWLKP